jgi:iron complex transport system substrate-binding protein
VLPLSRRSIVALLIGLSLSAAACGAGTSSPAASPSTAQPSAAASASPSPEAAFPITITDDEGTSVEIAADPTKIVSLTPANTEILFALGAGDEVVATDDGSDYPAEAASLPHVATFDGVDVEGIVGMEADLVLAGGLGFTPPDTIARLRDLGIPVLVLYAPSVEAVYEDIELVGAATGEGEAATALVDSMRSEMDGIAAAAGEGTRPRTFYEVGYTDATGQIFGPSDESFLAEMVTMAGGETITTGDPASYEIPLESLIEADPQLIVIGTNDFYAPTAEQVTARPGWDVLTAVKERDIVPVDDTEISRPGPRLPSGLRTLARTIRPDVTLPPAP